MWHGDREGRGRAGAHVGADLTSTLAGCFAIGAGLMYFLDPARGGRRRNLIRDKTLHAWNETGDALGRAGQSAWDHARGLAAETRASLTDTFGDEAVTDEQLCARVRSALGRAVSHPRAIEIEARDGALTVSGDVLADEVDSLLRTVSHVRGVKFVQNHLSVHRDPAGVPSLQGGSYRRGRSYDPTQESWSPPARALALAAGGALGFWGAVRRDWVGCGLGLLGTCLAARGLTNRPARRWVGIGGPRRAIEVQKTLNVRAPLDAVFGFFSNYQNFPKFMANVREVRDTGTGRSHWVVAGPAGVGVEWDADLTDYIPNQRLAWRSVEGATVENAGMIRFQETAPGSTRVDIHLSYDPPAGALGHWVAALFGADPKSEMDQDLARVKTMLETGNPPRDAARPVAAQDAARLLSPDPAAGALLGAGTQGGPVTPTA